MFKLESYITPLLFSYVDKYVKLKQEDFKLSLWGGDVTLHKLDLRLDAVERAIQLPITVKSGHVHELRIHVPWTKLTSEPVVITINTMECVLKKSVEELPPGYLESIVRKVIYNATVVINNLILKFVEDDIILSINVKNVECYSVNNNWESDIVDLALNNLVLKRILNVQDLTLCLDKCSASGKIEVYEDPLFYRCSLCVRIHMVYESSSARVPYITKANLNCDKLNFSISNIQVPMLHRLIELSIAIYYGNLKRPSSTEPTENKMERISFNDETYKIDPGGQGGQGWASWAWSYVPQILPVDEEESSMRKGPGIFEFAMFCREICVSFKIREKVQRKKSPTPKLISKGSMDVIWQCISAHSVLQGFEWINFTFGISNTLIYLAKEKENDKTSETERLLLKSGLEITDESHHLQNSLFDSQAPENNKELPYFVTGRTVYFEKYTEGYILEKFSSLWFDYVYYNEKLVENEEGSSVDKPETDLNKENSNLRFLTGPFNLYVSSKTVQAMKTFFDCLTDPSYEPYSKVFTDTINSNPTSTPTQQDIHYLQSYIPVRTYDFIFYQPSVIIYPNDRPKKVQIRSRDQSTKISWLMSCEKLQITTVIAMYAKDVVNIAYRLPAISEELYSAILNLEDECSKCSIIHPVSVVLYKRNLLYPEAWKNPVQAQKEIVFEMSQFQAHISKAQLYLAYFTFITWWNRILPENDLIPLSTLRLDCIKNDHLQTKLEITLAGLEFRDCCCINSRSFNGSLESILLRIKCKKFQDFTEIFRAPLKTDNLISEKGLLESQTFTNRNCTDFLKFTAQFPDLTNDTIVPSVMFVNIEGTVVCLDSLLNEWLAYSPTYEVVETIPVIEKKDENLSQVSASSTRESQTYSRSVSIKRPDSPEKEEYISDWNFHHLVLRYFNIIKRIHLQVNIKNWLIVITEKSIMSDIDRLKNTTDALVVATPSIEIYSQDHKECDAIQDLPIKGAQYSLTSEKLPWKVKVSNASAYSIHKGKGSTMVEPTCLTGSVAVSARYKTALSDDVSSLGFCLHIDATPVILRLEHDQIQMFYDSFVRILSGLLNGWKTTKIFIQKCLKKEREESFTETTINPKIQTDIKKESSINYESTFVSFTETSEASSIQHLDSSNSKRDDDAKISLWLQATAPKFIVKLLSKDGCIVTELEDLTSSFDLQKVFSKINIKLGKASIRHFYKDGNKWLLHKRGGMILMSYDGLKVKKCAQSGFLVVTITRALKRDLKKKLKQNSDCKDDSRRIYITEICVTLQPCDLVLATRLLHTLVHTFNVDTSTYSLLSLGEYFKGTADKTEPETLIPMINSSNLPLVYIETSNTRIFLLPSDKSIRDDKSDSGFCESSTPIELDASVIEISSIKVTPRATNPLSRIVVNEELYKRAVRASITLYPGSDIEDRQYQLDFSGVSLMCGRWEELMKSEKIDDDSTIQNPAFEWNNLFSYNSSDNPNSLQSIVNQMDIRLVLAPSIVYYPPEGAAQLVCGHSMEGCALSDVNVNLNITEIKLLYYIVFSNLHFVSLLPFFSDFFTEKLKEEKSVEKIAIAKEANNYSIPIGALITANRINLTISDTHSKILTSFIQPHTLLLSGNGEEKVEISCFDASLIVQHFDNEKTVDYALLETKTGRLNPKTGIPPALCTLVFFNFLSPTDSRFELRIERPVRFSLCDKRLTCLLETIEKLRPVFEVNFKPTKAEKTSKTVKTKDSSLKILAKEFELKATELNIALYGSDSNDNKIVLTIFEHFGHFHFDIKSRKSNIQYDILDMNIKCFKNRKEQLLLLPTSIRMECSMFETDIDIGFHIDDILIKMSENQYECLLNVYTHWTMQINEFLSKLSNNPTEDLENKANVKYDRCIFAFQTSYDDLRNGEMEYSKEEIEDLNCIPLPNKIVFAKQRNEAALLWSYDEPRTICQLTIKPIPLLVDELEEMYRDDISVSLILQYYNEAKREFEDYSKFDVGENFTCHARLWAVEERNLSKLQSARTWRIYIPPRYEHYSISQRTVRDSLVDECQNPVVDPMTLVAAAKLNSSILQSNQIFHMAKLCNIYPRTLMVLNINDFKSTFSSMNGNFNKLSANLMKIDLEVVEYRRLRKNKIATFEGNWDFNVVFKKAEKIDMTAQMKGKHEIIFNDSILHTIYATANLWKESTVNLTAQTLPVLECHLICNNTIHDIYCKQENTNETIHIESHQAFPFSWTNDCNGYPLIKLSLDRLYWSEAFSLDFIDINDKSRRYMSKCIKIEKDCVIVRIIRLSSYQSKIIIDGNVIFASRLDIPISIRSDVQDVERTMKIDSFSSGFSTINDSETKYFKIRFLSPNTLWSENFKIQRGSSCLLKVPLQDRINFITVCCHFIAEKVCQNETIDFVLFTPLFVIRNHLATPLLTNVCTKKSKDHQEITLSGKGQDYQLHLMAVDQANLLTFKAGPSLTSSSPAVSLSSDLLPTCDSLASTNTMELIDNWYKNMAKIWPYNGNKSEEDLDKLSFSDPPTNNDPKFNFGIKSTFTIQPPSPCQSDKTAMLNQPAVKLQVRLSSMYPGLKTLLIDVSPEYLLVNESSFNLVLSTNDEVMEILRDSTVAPPIGNSFKIGLQLEKDIAWSQDINMSDYDISSRFLHKVDNTLYLSDQMRIIIKSDEGLSILVLRAVERNGIRVIDVRDAYVLESGLEDAVNVQCLAVELKEERGRSIDIQNFMYTLKKGKKFSIPFWKVLEKDTINVPVLYLRFATESNDWSLPLRVRNPDTERIISFELVNSTPSIIHMQQRYGVTYLNVVENKCPMIVFHNYCTVNILVGEHVEKDGTIDEEQELLYSIPCILRQSSLNYTPSSIDRSYPSLTSATFKIVFALSAGQDRSWSSPILLIGDNELSIKFIHIPHYGDVKLHIEKHGSTSFVYLTQVTRFDIRAGRVRERCGSIKNDEDEALTKDESAKHITIKKDEAKRILECNFEFLLSDFQLRLTEYTTSGNRDDLICLTSQAINMNFRRFQEKSNDAYKWQIRNSIMLDIEGIQIENDRFGIEPFDFDIVFKRINESERLATIKLDLIECERAICIENASIVCRPIIVQCEDTLIYRLLKYLKDSLPVQKFRKQKEEDGGTKFSFRPIIVNSVNIAEIEVLLSVHAQIKVFVAADQSALKLSPYTKLNVRSTANHFIQDIGVHYASSALFRAGHVIASLELLGSPSTLLRGIGTGVSDFIRLPVEGIAKSGAKGLISGVSHGVASLASNISFATLTSITNFASSVSKNMDRLAMDEEHERRQASDRTALPDGVTSALVSGLSNLGLSLLSAVAGLADQPLRPIQDGSNSPGRVISGIGKGLVGVIAKPLGGAAELVSRSGKGLLRTAGLSRTRGRILGEFNKIHNYTEYRFCRILLEEVLFQTIARIENFNDIINVILTRNKIIILSDESFQILTEFGRKQVDISLSDKGIVLESKRKAEVEDRLARFIGAKNDQEEDNSRNKLLISIEHPKRLYTLLRSSQSAF
ncbi:DgyrCDS5226 [Dimorphilus gyrociliatus]|uniref:DgyrCDS5226 n=1 Tax=Dimorphilus gyrociliatus TaxID=2664684 RepID=A0A7I8VKV6_9ANNE|nr:DgyrCDS5226 [Dimorphilus gyrociliatus]